MFDRDNILKSPRDVSRDALATEPLRLVQEDPSRKRKARLWTLSLVCAALALAAGAVIWIWGVRTQRDNPGFWHLALVSLLFWLSVTQGMVALSVILRVSHASWRYPLNRLLDLVSLFGLWVPLLLPFLLQTHDVIYAMGSTGFRDNVWRVAGSKYWDAFTVGTAYIAGMLMLYLTALPDFALLRDRAVPHSRQQRFYTRLTRWHALLVTRWTKVGPFRFPGRLGVEPVIWTGAEHQWRVLRRAEGVLLIGVLLSFVGSQTVLGWDFQLASARNWDSSIFAPLYTLGSLLGALALTTLVMTAVNRILKGCGFISRQHYDSLGRFMIALGMVWFYFRFCDYLTAWYGHLPDEWYIQNNRTAAFPILAGLMTFGCFVAPVFGNMIGRIRTSVAGLCTISVFVLAGLAAQRYLDTVPTFAPNFRLDSLLPTVPGVTVFGGVGALFVLTYLLGARYFPIMSWWGTSKERTRTAERKLGNAVVTVMVEDPPVWET